MRRSSLLLPVLLITAVSACSSRTPAPSPPPADGVPAKKATATPSDAAASPRLLSFGRPMVWQRKDGSGHGTVKVLGYRQPVPGGGSSAGRESEFGGDGKAGSVRAVLDVEMCAESGSVSAAGSDWHLLYDDGADVSPSEGVGDAFPQPAFPVETQVRAGECTRGKVTYAVPAGRWPERIHYVAALDSGDMEAPGADGWAVPGAAQGQRP
ncbi:hypothetical protein [Streptomyces sp. NPDC052496]|uniref:hypothetical protein n=1 Tax=Streptomyces sp. NPDC052496 TaxID=3154951 RepID=UPI00342789C6